MQFQGLKSEGIIIPMVAIRKLSICPGEKCQENEKRT
jgi:hypothetical protein